MHILDNNFPYAPCVIINNKSALTWQCVYHVATQVIDHDATIIKIHHRITLTPVSWATLVEFCCLRFIRSRLNHLQKSMTLDDLWGFRQVMLNKVDDRHSEYSLLGWAGSLMSGSFLISVKTRLSAQRWPSSTTHLYFIGHQCVNWFEIKWICIRRITCQYFRTVVPEAGIKAVITSHWYCGM